MTMVIILLQAALLHTPAVIQSRGAVGGNTQVAFLTSREVPGCNLLAPRGSFYKHRLLVAEVGATGYDQGIHQGSKAKSVCCLAPFCNPERLIELFEGLISSLIDGSESQSVAIGLHPSKTCPSSEARCSSSGHNCQLPYRLNSAVCSCLCSAEAVMVLCRARGSSLP